MKSKKINLLVTVRISCIFLLAGCASMPTMDKPMEKTRTFEATFDQVWSAAINALTSSNQMITLSEKDSGVIGVDRQFDRQQIWDYVLIDGFSKFWTTWTSFRSRANFVVQALGPTQTKITINTQIRGDTKQYEYNVWWGMTSASNVERGLNSNGKLEKEYLDMIEAQLPDIRKLKWIKEEGKGTQSQPPSPAPSKSTTSAGLKTVGMAALLTPTAIASVTAKTATETGRALVGSGNGQTSSDLEAQRRNLIQEQERIAKEIALLEAESQLESERKKVEEQKARLETLKQTEREALIQSQQELAERERQRKEKFKIESMGLAKDVDNLWIGSHTDVITDTFSLSSKKVVWFCKFKYGLRSFAASVKAPKFEATWFGPDGKIFKQEGFSTSFGNTDLARNELKIDPSHPNRFLGRWRVEIRHKGEIVDEREFEIVSV